MGKRNIFFDKKLVIRSVQQHHVQHFISLLVDYIGLVSLTLTLAFILALVSCIGCVFECEGDR